MSHIRRLKNELFTTGIYKSRDFIANFKIKVKLEKSVNVRRKCTNDESAQPGIELQPLSPKDEKEIEEKEFSWQEKVFSMHEVQKYSNITNCKTTLEKKYHKDVSKIIMKGKPHNRLFTYINSDNYIHLNENKENILIPANENYLTDKIKNLDLRHINLNNPIPKANIVENYSSQRIEPVYMESMTIMVDVSESEDLKCKLEVPLCTITFSADGAVIVTPDFNYSREPYQFEIENEKTKIFRYTIEHISPTITKEEDDKEKKIHQELYSQRLEIVKKAVGDEFEMPSPNFLKVFLFGEIVSARDFGWKNLYVNYILDLPPNWKVSTDDQQLTGSTLTASTTINNRDDVAHFSYPFSIELNLDIQHSNIEFIKWPQLLIQVWSKDYWNRYRVEGYGHVNIPSKPGIYKLRIETWQPISNSIIGKLCEFFLGSYSELDNLAFPAVASQKCHPLNLVGIHTKSNGSVDIKMQIIQQSMDFLESDLSGVSLKTLLSGLGSMSIQSSVVTVLEAFQKARHRMLKARESLLTSSTSFETSCTKTKTSSTSFDTSCPKTKTSSNSSDIGYRKTKSFASSEVDDSCSDLSDSCEAVTESSSTGLINTVAIIHNSEDGSSVTSQDDTVGMYGKESSSSSSTGIQNNDNLGVVSKSASVNEARMRRRQKKLSKLPPLSRSSNF